MRQKLFKHRKWREYLVKQCRQINKFAVNDFNTDISRVSFRRPARAGLKVLEPYAGKLARTVLRGRKLPGPTILKKGL